MCENQQNLAVISGKNLLLNDKVINQLFIFKRKKREYLSDHFRFYKKMLLKDMEKLGNIAMQFYFKKKSPGDSRAEDFLIMATANEILTLNIDTEEIETIYEYKKALGE